MKAGLSLSNTYKIAITDIVVLTAVYFIPAFVHATQFPLYYFEPMRLLLFAALLISKNNINACFLAVTLPLVSTILPPHHPPFYKAVIMSVELLVNVGCFVWAVNKIKWPPFILFFISTVISKILYYGLKFIFIKMSLIEGNLITTDLFTQLITLSALSILFAIFYRRKNLKV
ncbi:MAG: hypothetical protein V4685_02695 [Bacteroidota bacterium]